MHKKLRLRVHTLDGDVLEVDAPRRLVTTEQMGGADWPPTHNVVELTEQDGRTVLTGTIRYPSKEARDGAYASDSGAWSALDAAAQAETEFREAGYDQAQRITTAGAHTDYDIPAIVAERLAALGK